MITGILFRLNRLQKTHDNILDAHELTMSLLVYVRDIPGISETVYPFEVMIRIYFGYTGYIPRDTDS